MQNIPSHATDIRHMFHATPARFEDVVCSAENGLVHVELSNVCLVDTQQGPKEAQQLVKDDVVKLYHGDEELWGSVFDNQIVKINGDLRCKLIVSA